MDAVLFALLAVISLLVGWAVRILAGDRPILADVFRYRGPGWPSGVQEDDDLHWHWRPVAPEGPRTERLRPHLAFGARLERGRRRPR